MKSLRKSFKLDSINSHAEDTHVPNKQTYQRMKPESIDKFRTVSLIH